MWRLMLALTVTIIVAVGVVVLLVIQEVRQDHASGSLPKVPMCASLPEHGPDNTVALMVSHTTNHPGMVCVRVYNGAQKFIHSTEREPLRLDCRWFGLLWFPYFQLGDVPFLGLRRAVRGGEFVVPPGISRERYLRSPYDPVLPWMCRVRLRYQEIPEEKERTVYSAEFSIP